MTASRPCIGVLDEIHPAAMDVLAEVADVLGPADQAAARRRCDALIVRNSPITAQDIAAAPRLRVIGKHGAGIDNIDVASARSSGILVLSTPGLNAESVADLAIGFALGLIRNICGHTAALRAGHPLVGEDRVGFELAELPCGVIGLGAIGSAVSRRLRLGFGCEVAAIDPGLATGEWPEGVRRHHDLAELLATSRLVFLHAPLDETTCNMLGERMLRTLPPGAFLVNCARGGIVDEEALAGCLSDGHLAGAASDVFVTEPPAADHPLLSCQRFLATPHLGASTHGGLERVGTTIARRVVEALASLEGAGAQRGDPT